MRKVKEFNNIFYKFDEKLKQGEILLKYISLKSILRKRLQNSKYSSKIL
jgi:hypothetical protein